LSFLTSSFFSSSVGVLTYFCSAGLPPIKCKVIK
jgi:hypothetical protein